MSYLLYILKLDLMNLMNFTTIFEISQACIGKLFYKHISYSEGILNQAKIFKSNLAHEFKYHLFETNSYKELSKIMSDVDYAFKKSNNDLKFK